MTEIDKWHYLPLARLDLVSDTFSAYLVATHRPRGRSSCAIVISLRGNIVIKLGLASKGKSSLWRAYLGGAAAIAELLPLGSTVRLCCKHKPVNDILIRVDELRNAMWRKSDKTPVSDKEILKRYLSARGEPGRNGIDVKPTVPESEDDHEALDSLYKLADEVCGTPSRKTKRRRKL